jgi:hypothetical protein
MSPMALLAILRASLGAPPAAATLVASPAEQAVAVVAGFVLKPTYMLLSLLLARALRGRREPGLAAVRRGLLAFFAGEAACAMDFLLGGPGDLLDALHGLGMVAAGGLLASGLFQVVDERVWHLSAPEHPCSATRFCGRCWKREEVPCAVQRLWLVTAAALGLLAALPLTAPLSPRVAAIEVHGTLVDYGSSPLLQWLQFRLLPVAAIAAFAAALALATRGPAGLRRAQPWFFAGLGVLLFVLLRFLLLSAFTAMPIWSDFWEEATELAAMLAVGVFLWAWRVPLPLLPAPASAGAGGG